MVQFRIGALFAVAATAVILGVSANAASDGAQPGYAAQNETALCGFLPYRPADGDRFAEPRQLPADKATIGVQATYSFAWDLARPSFMAAEVAEDLINGASVEQVRKLHGAALSLGEYMLFAAKEFETAPTPDPRAADDIRVALAAERPQTFHNIYVAAKHDYEAIVAEIGAGAEDDAGLKEIALAWRPAYALVAKAHADDKRIELLDTNLDADAIAEKEAVACLAHAVALAAGPGASEGPASAKAATARWTERPPVDARSLGRAVRGAFFDHEDAGDDLTAAINALPDGPVDLASMRAVASAYAEFVTTATALVAARRETQ